MDADKIKLTPELLNLHNALADGGEGRDQVNTFCEKAGHICTLSYCDNNGCNERKRNLVEAPALPLLQETLAADREAQIEKLKWPIARACTRASDKKFDAASAALKELMDLAALPLQYKQERPGPTDAEAIAAGRAAIEVFKSAGSAPADAVYRAAGLRALKAYDHAPAATPVATAEPGGTCIHERCLNPAVHDGHCECYLRGASDEEDRRATPVATVGSEPAEEVRYMCYSSRYKDDRGPSPAMGNGHATLESANIQAQGILDTNAHVCAVEVRREVTPRVVAEFKKPARHV